MSALSHSVDITPSTPAIYGSIVTSVLAGPSVATNETRISSDAAEALWLKPSADPGEAQMPHSLAAMPMLYHAEMALWSAGYDGSAQGEEVQGAPEVSGSFLLPSG